MAYYFLSDVHLRLDQPDRALRLARLVDRLGPDDPLTVVGDLCDFWYIARQFRTDPMICPGLRSLANYRDRGGSITILAGNHDTWSGPFYERTLGALFVPDKLEFELQGLRTFVAHGHRLGSQTRWKEALESRLFLELFRKVPRPMADALGRRLRASNARHQETFDRRGTEIYRKFAARRSESHDLVILGHVHLPLDTGPDLPQLVILGGWQTRSCYLVVEEGRTRHVVEADPS